ncbi:MAG TPA: branched-chain amino acid ABC transporter permease, partial [Chondromyces sp.]|nr:branched-chain amino acid ABC transporter permease [Chondromyces sp.]
MKEKLAGNKGLLFFLLLSILLAVFTSGTSSIIYTGTLILIYVIITMGLNVLVGYGGQVSIGHASFLAIGAYASAILTLTYGLPFWMALPLAGIFTSIIGFVVGLPAVKLSGHFLGVATLGFGVAVPELLLKWDVVTGGFSGLFPERPVLFGYVFDTDVKMYFLVLVITILVTIGINNLIKGRIGRAFIAIRESEVAATSIGINVPLYKTLMFSISAFYTGIAGSLYAHFINFISPHDFNLTISFTVLAMVVLGGLASKTGPIIGAIILTLIPQYTDHIAG